MPMTSGAARDWRLGEAPALRRPTRSDRKLLFAGALGLAGMIGAQFWPGSPAWFAAVVASAGAFAVLRRTGALVLTVFGMFYYFAAAAAAGEGTTPILTALAYSGLAAVYLPRLIRPSPLLSRTTLSAFVLTSLLYLVMIASYVLASDPDGTADRKMSLAPFFMVSPFLAGLCLSRQDLEELVRIAFGIAVLLALVTAAHTVNVGLLDHARISVWPGWNPISHAMTLATGVAVALPGLWLANADVRRWCIVAVAAFALMTILSGSRGPLISVIIAGTAYVLLVRRTRPLARMLVVAGGLALAYSASLALPENVLQRFSVQQVRELDYAVNSAAQRETLLADAWRAFLDNPIAGVGVGNFRLHSTDGHGYAHNLTLEVLAEMGIVGAAFFVPLVLLALRRALRLMRSSSADRREDWLAHALGLLVVLFLVESNISGDLQGSSGFWLAIGIAAASGRLVLTPAAAARRPGVVGSVVAAP